MKDNNLERLIQKLKQGDGSILEAIYSATHRAVFATLFSILKDYQLAEDAMQNTYIKVYSAIGTYKDNTNPFAWISQIAKNEAFMIIRKRKHEISIDECGEIRNNNDEYINVENKIVLNTLLSVLNEKEREIILLHDGAGLKHREIAKMLDRPLGSVLWAYNNAFKKLRKEVITNEG